MTGQVVSYSEEKIAIFIDGANLYTAARALEFDIDYSKLLNWSKKQGRLLRAFYYTALVEDQEYSPLRPLVDWLDYNGFTVVTKPSREFTDSQGRRRIKGQIDIDLAVDMMEMAQGVDHIILFSGDPEYRRVIEAVQRQGVRVTVASTMRSSPPMAGDDLRRQADHFLEIDLIAEDIERAARPGANDTHPDDDEDEIFEAGQQAAG